MAKISGREDEKVNKLLEQVEKLVEHCLCRYMNKEETVKELFDSDKIEPYFTELVWERLEKQNEDFFKVYNLSLLVKEQILEFNRLLSQQVMLMHRSNVTGIGPGVISNGYHVSPTQQMSTSFAAQSNILHRDMYNNYGSSMLSGEPGRVMSDNGKNINMSASMLSHNPNSGFGRTMNGNIIKAEPSYFAGSSHFDYSPPNNFQESRQQMGDTTCLPNFSNIEPNAQHLNDYLLDGDTSSYGFLEPMPSSFDFPGLRTDFTNLPENNSGQSYIAPDVNNSVDSNGPIQMFDPASQSSRH